MPHLLFSLAEPRAFVLAVLCIAISGYFLTVRHKTRDLVFLIGAFSCWTGHFLLAVSYEAFYPFPVWLSILEMLAGLSGLVLFVCFAYHFRGNPSAREFRIGITSATLIVVLACSVLAFEFARNQALTWCVGSGASLLLFIWAEGVLIRRWYSRRGSGEARPYRSFALIFLLSVFAVGIYFLRDLGRVSDQTASLFASLLYLSTLVGFTLVYINHSAVPTTFQVKIAGVALFTTLAVLTVAWTALSPSPVPVTGVYSAVSGRALRLASSGIPVNQTDTGVEIDQMQPDNRLAIRKSVMKCNECIIGSTLFVLVFFPLFFRKTLIQPLDSLLLAVGRLDEGVRDIELPVTVNDEIGRLTTSFNRMTHSLKVAEADLKDYAGSLELKVSERTAELAQKNQENEHLLLNILPASIAERLKRGEALIADACSESTVLFADIVGFTDLSSRIPAAEVVKLLGGLISEFDDLAQQYGVEKIKTIGDSYMAVAGLPQARADHAEAAVRLALKMLHAAEKRKTPTGCPLQLRIGISSGPVIAGVIGTHKFAYDLWGDTVNTASRMESHGVPGRIQVSESTYALLRDRFQLESRGEIPVKGKGLMRTYFLAETETRVPARIEMEQLCAVA